MAFPIKVLLKRLMPTSLLGRSLLIIMTPLVLTIVLATFIFFDRHWSTTTHRLVTSLAGEISMVMDHIDRANGNEDTIIYIQVRAQSDLGITITFADPTYTAPTDNSSLLTDAVYQPLADALLEKGLKRFSIHPYYDDKDWLDISFPYGEDVLIMQVPGKRLFSSTTYVFLISMIGGGFILMIVAILFMRNQVRPVRRLALAAERLGKGEDVHRFKPEGAREVRQAATAFLVMRERIKRQVKQRTDMLAGVSHDLRTPLTRLKLELEMLGDTESILDMKDDIASMEHMIDGYLAFARGDDDEGTSSLILNDLLADCVGDARRHGQTIYFDDAHTDVVLRLRVQAIRRMLMNIISNAGKYANATWIHVNPLPNAVEIWIEDNGPGIDPQLYDDVFRPFYRADAARNLDTNSVGLGLSIALDVAQRHGGDIRLDKSTTHNGLKVVIRLPL